MTSGLSTKLIGECSSDPSADTPAEPTEAIPAFARVAMMPPVPLVSDTTARTPVSAACFAQAAAADPSLFSLQWTSWTGCPLIPPRALTPRTAALVAATISG